MRAETAQQAAVTAGLVTAPTGVALLAVPQIAGVAGLGAAARRAIGVTDLALAAGLIAGRPRWPWVAARAAANVPTAVVLARAGTQIGRLAAAALLVLTCVDAAAARSLHGSRR